jgi:hypothetical protein
VSYSTIYRQSLAATSLLEALVKTKTKTSADVVSFLYLLLHLQKVLPLSCPISVLMLAMVALA